MRVKKYCNIILQEKELMLWEKENSSLILTMAAASHDILLLHRHIIFSNVHTMVDYQTVTVDISELMQFITQDLDQLQIRETGNTSRAWRQRMRQ